MAGQNAGAHTRRCKARSHRWEKFKRELLAAHVLVEPAKRKAQSAPNTEAMEICVLCSLVEHAPQATQMVVAQLRPPVSNTRNAGLANGRLGYWTLDSKARHQAMLL
jgi:hypothetical protein